MIPMIARTVHTLLVWILLIAPVYLPKVLSQLQRTPGDTEDCVYYYGEMSLTVGRMWHPTEGPLEFTVLHSGGRRGLRFGKMTSDALSFGFRGIRISTRLTSQGGTGSITWYENINSGSLESTDPQPMISNDGMVHTYSLNISAEGLVSCSEVAVDGSLMTPPLLTYSDTTLDLSVPWYYQIDHSPDEYGVLSPPAKVCNVRPPVISEFKQAFQSSTSLSSIAARAVDGLVYRGNEYALTDENANSYWWRVDLGKEYVILYALFYVGGPPQGTATNDSVVVGSNPDNFPEEGITCGDPINWAGGSGGGFPLPNYPIPRTCPDDTVAQFVQIMNEDQRQYAPFVEVTVYGYEVPDDLKKTIKFSRATYSFDEGDTATIEIVRTGSSQFDASIDISSVDGTATAPEDFALISETVTFNSGEDTKTVSLTIVNDAVFERNDERLSLRLTNAVGGEIANPDRAVVTISDDDAPTVLTKHVTFKQLSGWFGGFIADMEFKIGMCEWRRIEVVFPRHVYKLEIVGSDARVQMKEQEQAISGGQRVSTTATIVPKSNSSIRPGRNGEIRVTMVGKIWREFEGLKPNIEADIYYYEC